MIKERRARKIDAIIFDLDNTLYDANKAYAVALSKLGLRPGQASYLTARANVKRRLGNNNVSARNRLLYFKEYLSLRKQHSPERILDMMSQYENSLHGAIKKQWFELGRKDFFAKLAKKYPLVLVSNENVRTQLIKLRAIDPDGRLFHSLVTSEEVGFEKPHLGVFRKASENLGISLTRCMVVGDSVQDDIKPAVKFGSPLVLCTREFDPDKNPSDLPRKAKLIRKLTDINKFLIS